MKKLEVRLAQQPFAPTSSYSRTKRFKLATELAEGWRPLAGQAQVHAAGHGGLVGGGAVAGALTEPMLNPGFTEPACLRITRKLSIPGEIR